MKTFFQRSGIRTLIVLFGSQIVEAAVKSLTGMDAAWAPYVAAGLTALWNVYRNPSIAVPPPGQDAVVIRPLS